MFNNINALEKMEAVVLNTVKVPLAYGPAKFLARLDQEAGFDAPLAIKLPRMAFEITSLELDTTQKVGKLNKIVESHGSDVTKKKQLNTIHLMILECHYI